MYLWFLGAFSHCDCWGLQWNFVCWKKSTLEMSQSPIERHFGLHLTLAEPSNTSRLSVVFCGIRILSSSISMPVIYWWFKLRGLFLRVFFMRAPFGLFAFWFFSRFSFRKNVFSPVWFDFFFWSARKILRKSLLCSGTSIRRTVLYYSCLPVEWETTNTSTLKKPILWIF